MRYFFKIFLWCTALWLAVSAVAPVVAWAEADAVACTLVSGVARTAAGGLAEGKASRVFEVEASRGEEQGFEQTGLQTAHGTGKSDGLQTTRGTGQDKPVIFLKKTERLNESRILARGVRGFRGLLPHYGLPEYGTSVGAAVSPLHSGAAGSGGVLRTNVLCDEMAGAAVSQEKGVWTSMNMELKMPNWVAWDLNLAASGADRDPFMAKMPAGTVRLPQHLWRMILDECYRFAFDKALSPVTIVCGPLVSASAITSNPAPAASPEGSSSAHAASASASASSSACSSVAVAPSGTSTAPVPAASAPAPASSSATASSPANSSVASAPSDGSTAASASASAPSSSSSSSPEGSSSATASSSASSSVASAPSDGSTAASASAYAGPMPYEYFVVVCKKVRGGLGWQSMGFLLPNTANLQAAGGLFKYSVSVNMVEYKSGFDFFKRLPSHLEELIEEMTTYELFCPYIEDENYLDDPFESIDFRELMNDSLEDIRDSY